MGTDPGLRERKKRATRQAISDIATMLFMERGFDQVTVAEVARRANVSKMTVFNYFTCKEDLFLDRLPELRELLVGAVRGRPAGEPVLSALRGLLADLTRRDHPLSGMRYWAPFWQVVRDSPALTARSREHDAACATALAQAIDGEEPDPATRTLAGAVLVAIGVIQEEAGARAAAGVPHDELRQRQLTLIDEQFALLERGFAR